MMTAEQVRTKLAKRIGSKLRNTDAMVKRVLFAAKAGLSEGVFAVSAKNKETIAMELAGLGYHVEDVLDSNDKPLKDFLRIAW
jgi:phosphoribosyl-ATP pyrophosphohydrolase